MKACLAVIPTILLPMISAAPAQAVLHGGEAGCVRQGLRRELNDAGAPMGTRAPLPAGPNDPPPKPGALWESDAPIPVGLPDGTIGNLTLAFDAEVPLVEVLRGVYRDPHALREYERLCLSSNIALDPIDLQDRLRLSDAQFRRFALRKGVDPGKTEFLLSDLNPAYSAQLLADPQLDLDAHRGFRDALRLRLEDQIRRQGLPVSSEIDPNGEIELAHASFETSPRRYREVIRDLHDRIPNPQTHFHFGVPASVDAEDVWAVAQALETRITLELASRNPKSLGPLAYMHGTTLRRNHKARGNVKVWLKRFGEPAPSHDIEIRQYPNLAQPLRDIEFAGALLKEPRRLRKSRELFGSGKGDPRLGNIEGALLHAAFHIGSSPEGSRREIAARLKALAGKARAELEEDGEITLELRLEIRATLEKDRVRDLLNDSETFLGGAPDPAR